MGAIAASEVSARPVSGGASVRPSPAVLVVDDRPEELFTLKAVLGEVELVTATTGAMALRLLLQRDFAAVVLDLVMPGMDGLELAGLIRARERTVETPILFLTGADGDLGAARDAYAAGAVDFLAKPIDADVLKAKLAVFVKLFEKDQRIREQARALVESERRAKELELSRLKSASERRTQSLADAVPQLMWLADADGRVVRFNRRWIEHVGPTTEASWLAAVHPDDRTECERTWREALEQGTDFEAECRLRGADGGYRWSLCRAVPERAPGGELTGWIGTHTDLDEMFKARARAEAAILARDEFLSVASHELRTPLSALLMQLGSLDRNLARDPAAAVEEGKVTRKIAAALKQTSRLTTLVDQLLDVSRVASKRLVLTPEPCDLAAVVREVLERFSEEAERCGCEVSAELGPGAPGVWDKGRLEQVVTNLVSNALKYGRGAPVEVTLSGAADAVELAVRDHGIGISEADQARIFDRFERAAPVKHYGGLGLGLYISRQIVEAHGGRIEVASTPGAGSRFVVRLPVEAPHARDPASAEPTA